MELNSFDQSVVLNVIEGANVLVFEGNPNQQYRHLYKAFLILHRKADIIITEGFETKWGTIWK